MALLPVHSQNFPALRKNSFKRACRRVIQQQAPVSYRGQPLTLQLLRRTGNCPPAGSGRPPTAAPRTRRAGQQAKPVRVMSWNAGHLGQQQWFEIKTWLQLQLEADKVCDVLILQETHWQESAEFTVSGWYCISSASKPVAHQRKPRKEPKQSKGTSASGSAPSITRADGLMVLLSPKFQKKQIRWKEWTTGRVLEVRAFLAGSRVTFLAVYQHVWSSNKTQQDNKSDRASVLSSLTKAIKQVPQRDTLIVAGDFNSSLIPRRSR